MKIISVSGFGPVVSDVQASRAFYSNVLGIPFTGEESYLYNESVDGVNHLALWLLSRIARSSFGTDTWPSDVPVPQGWIEFVVEDIVAATAELEARGMQLLISTRKMPWGQIVTRFLSPEGLLIELASPHLDEH